LFDVPSRRRKAVVIVAPIVKGKLILNRRLLRRQCLLACSERLDVNAGDFRAPVGAAKMSALPAENIKRYSDIEQLTAVVVMLVKIADGSPFPRSDLSKLGGDQAKIVILTQPVFIVTRVVTAQSMSLQIVRDASGFGQIKTPNIANGHLD
jgi:hypothetical protein